MSGCTCRPISRILLTSGVADADLWWNGPEWLQDRNTLPPNPVTKASEVTEAESKIVLEVLAAITVDEKPNEFDQLLESYDLRKVLRVCAWVVRLPSRIEGKAYLVQYVCSLSRALHLEVLPNQETTTFLGSFKRMVAHLKTS